MATNTPDVYTYTVKAEISADNDGWGTEVTVINTGGMGVAICRAIAVEAMAEWRGRYSLDYTLRTRHQGYDSNRRAEIIVFTIENN